MKYAVRSIWVVFIYLVTSYSCFSQEDDLYSGSFIHRESGLRFKATKKEKDYDCVIRFQGQSYRFTAAVALGILYGEYLYEGKSVPVTFSKVLGSYFLVSEGYTIPMEWDNSANANEADPGSSSMPAGVSQGMQPSRTMDWLLPEERVVRAKGLLVNDPYGLYSCHLPENWKRTDNETYISLSTEGHAAMINIYPHLMNDIDKAMEGLKDLIDPENQTELYITPRKIQKDRYIVQMRGISNEKNVYVEYACIFSPYGGGMFINLNLGGDPYREMFKGLVQSIMATVVFKKPSVESEALKWQKKLTGKQLLYLKTDSYGTQRTEINLWEGGDYSYQNETSMLSTGSSTLSYAGNIKHEGQWKVYMKSGKPVLVLCEKYAEFYDYIITPSVKSENEVFLNGRRYFIR